MAARFERLAERVDEVLRVIGPTNTAARADAQGLDHRQPAVPIEPAG
jgi:hypothetical protein